MKTIVSIFNHKDNILGYFLLDDDFIENLTKKEVFEFEYDLNSKDSVTDLLAEFFADSLEMEKIEIDFCKHSVGYYFLENYVNYHCQVYTDEFNELMKSWKSCLSEYSNKPPQYLIAHMQNMEVESFLKTI